VQCWIGSFSAVKKLQSGPVAIKATNSSQASAQNELNIFIDSAVKAAPLRTFNSSRGVIRCRNLRDCGDEEVFDNLGSEGVIAVKHFFPTRNGIKEPTNTLIVTFNFPLRPSHIKVGYLRVVIVVYGSAREPYLQPWDGIQNAALRVCLGVFRTSSIPSLHVEANEMPLALRRQMLTLQYVLKLK
jgi:hypothetical protein